MVWVYIFMDVVLLCVIALLIYFLIRLWTKRKGLHVSPLSQFRNDDLYEKSMQDKKKLAHIEETVKENEPIDTDPLDGCLDNVIRDSDISFSDGYGIGKGGAEYDED